ncbi:uncharacterized protein FOMMEDRAFT_22760 [Fomitiporia mediterranea MF3/22]|uniref:uncharacterized protein n=1 Tax=Fomitiporia mediterranea (strain MF3/22) TaxID=694068 RepID=UPI00044096E7|nr:uncharacterized protein FOMMEDRAFT_22760 [Fomitiporia mediterranea MF3/22]EJC99628.1 hypothetical protein FOMMEDRAFT_22760 [Fomitiporia mediterranea MF3/22]
MITDLNSFLYGPADSDDDAEDLYFSEDVLREFAKTPIFAKIDAAEERSTDELKRELGLLPDCTKGEKSVNEKHMSKKRKLNGAASSSRVATTDASHSSHDHHAEDAQFTPRNMEMNRSVNDEN